MGIKERQLRDREAVHRAILDAARALFVTEGYLNVSIRKIAEQVEYSPAAIYSYFPSKDDIFFALAEEGFHLLFESHGTVDSPAGPLDAIRGMFWRFYEFSKKHPEYYALMFVDRSVPRISRDWERFGFVREMRNKASQKIQRCIDEGIFPPETRPDTVFRLLCAVIHGPAVWRLCDRMLPGEDADALVHDVIEAVIAGLRSGVRLTFAPAACYEAPTEALAQVSEE